MITLAHQDYPDLTLVHLCDLLGVSRSWYYEQIAQPDQDAQDIALRDQIEHIILEFSGYGYRRVTRALLRQGIKVNHKRVLRIMREESLLCHLKKHARANHHQFAARMRRSIRMWVMAHLSRMARSVL